MASEGSPIVRVAAVRVFAAGNRYARVPVIRARLEPAASARLAVAALGAEFVDRLRAQHAWLRMPLAVPPDEDSRSVAPGTGPTVAGLIGRLAVQLQDFAGLAVDFSQVLATDRADAVELVFEYRFDDAARAALSLALKAIENALPSARDSSERDRAAGDVAAGVANFAASLQWRSFSLHSRSIVREVEKRGIAWEIAADGTNLRYFGEGRYRRRALATATPQTGYIATQLAGDKLCLVTHLRRNGVPAPRQFLVRSSAAAVAAAGRIGFPVVVKPADAHGGRGVSVGLKDAAEVERAHARAATVSRNIIVESFIPGDDHRILVLGDRLISAVKRVPAHVIGDGILSIDALIAEANADPRRSDPLEGVLAPIVPDVESERLLRQRGYGLESVPPAGEVVYLRSAANRSQGGVCFDLTGSIHPDNRDLVLRAVRLTGLAEAGVDFLCPDITRSYREVGGGICEINRQPGLLPHLAASGTGSEVAAAWVDHLFPGGDIGRIPIAAVAGGQSGRAIAHRLAALLAASGRAVGLAASDGVWSDGFQIATGDHADPNGVKMVVRDPMIDAAVIETSLVKLGRVGLGYQRCDHAAIWTAPLDTAADGGEGGEGTRQGALALLRVAAGTVWLDAEERGSMALASRSVARRLGYVSLRGRQPAWEAHAAAGGHAVFVDWTSGRPMAIIQSGGTIVGRFELAVAPDLATREAETASRARLFAVALGHGMGVDTELIGAMLSE